MKIDFKNITVTELDGTTSFIDVSEVFGNAIYKFTSDLGELDLAMKIYKEGEVDLSPVQAESIKKYTCFSQAYAVKATCDALDKIILSETT